MPNGSDVYWVRLCLAIDGFRGRYNKWPTRAILNIYSARPIEGVLGSKSFSVLTDHIELILDEDAFGIIAEDDSGQQFVYGKDMDSFVKPDIGVREWLEIDSLPEYQD